MAVFMEWETVSHWSVCFVNREMVAANARISCSIRFSFMNDSCTPRFTASTISSAARAAFLIASFFAFSATIDQSLPLSSDWENREISIRGVIGNWLTCAFAELEGVVVVVLDQLEQSFLQAAGFCLRRQEGRRRCHAAVREWKRSLWIHAHSSLDQNRCRRKTL